MINYLQKYKLKKLWKLLLYYNCNNKSNYSFLILNI